MAHSLGAEIEEANTKAVKRVLSAEAVVTDVKPAIKAIPGFKPNLITHSGPPIEWAKMCNVQKYAILNMIRYEGLAEKREEAERLIRIGEILVKPNHNYGNVSGMCGITSASMPVLIINDKVNGNMATDMQQTEVTAFGQQYENGLKELEFVQKTLGPIMSATLKEAGGLNGKELLAKGLQMGDELHGLFDASRGVLVNWLMPHMLRTGFSKDTLAKVGDYFMSNQGRWYCGNIMMGSCKLMMDAARGVKYSTIVTAMSRNGVEFGVKVSGLGDRWFTGPAGRIKGYTFPGFKVEDAAPDIGDSAISETRGLGATAMPASPSHARLMGENFQDAVNHTRLMRQVSILEDPMFRIPYMDFIGVPVGIDIRKVVELGIVPRINTGMAHKAGGYGMIGTGVVDAPIESFKNALLAFGEQYR